MIRCETCGRYIYHKHGNTKYCDSCKDGKESKYVDLKVEIELGVLLNLIKDSEELQRLKSIEEEKETIIQISLFD